VFFLVPLAALLLLLPNISPAVSAQDKDAALRPTVRTADKYDLSPPLRSIKPILTKQTKKGDDDRGGSGPINNTQHDPDPVVQNTKTNGAPRSGFNSADGSEL
jgi:hypothetical protein